MADASQVCMDAEAAEADIISLAETNLDWKHSEIRHNFREKVHQYWDNTSIATSSSDLRTKSPHQQGGTATIVRNPWSGPATMAADTSGLGRWTEATINGKQDRKVTIITAYRSNPGDIKNGKE